MSANPDEPAEGDRWPSTARSRAVLGVGVGAVGVIGLVFGLGVAGLTGSGNVQVAGPPPSTTGAPGSSQGSAPVSSTQSAPPGSLAAASTTTTEAAESTTTTTAATSTTRASSSSSSTTALSTSSQVTTTPAPTSPPAIINVAFSQGSDGALTVPRNGSAIIQLTNTGGQQGQFSLSLPTPDYTLSQTNGTVAPGDTVTVTVRETRNKAHSSAINAVVSPGTRLTIVVRTP